MAAVDERISGLDALTTPASADLLAIVDDPAGTPVTKKIEYSNLVPDLTTEITALSELASAASGDFLPILDISGTPAAKKITYTNLLGSIDFTSLTTDINTTLSTAGSTRTISSEHSDDTNAASDATLVAETGGTSGGDPYVKMTIGTARSFVVGPDNSDSDILKINTTNSATLTPSSGTELWNMTVDGERLMPLQPCFAAYLASPVLNVTGDDTVYTVLFDTERVDTTNDYNTGTGTFTAPVTGRYLLSGQVEYRDVNDQSHFKTAIVTSNHTWETWTSYNADADDDHMATVVTIADMDASDTAYYTMSSGGGASGKVVDVGRAFFSGFLLS
jgi:hypothetical protein